MTGCRPRSDILKRKETWTRDRHAAWEMLAFVGEECSSSITLVPEHVGFPVDRLLYLSFSRAQRSCLKAKKKRIINKLVIGDR